MTKQSPTKAPTRVIKLKPEPDLAAKIDAAAARDRRTPPAWVLATVENVLAGKIEQLEFSKTGTAGAGGGK
jgi:hypothetical protein